jgi:hypothetical protein
MWERRNGKFRLSRQPITVKEFAKKWDDDYVTVQLRLGRMKESSAQSCRSCVRLHIVPFFERIRLDAITLPLVREFMKTLLTKELSPKTVLNVANSSDYGGRTSTSRANASTSAERSGEGSSSPRSRGVRVGRSTWRQHCVLLWRGCRVASREAWCSAAVTARRSTRTTSLAACGRGRFVGQSCVASGSMTCATRMQAS